jgi:hypothetical protein
MLTGESEALDLLKANGILIILDALHEQNIAMNCRQGAFDSNALQFAWTGLTLLSAHNR